MVADDQALIRESLKIILSAHPDIEVVATVEDGNHVLSSEAAHETDHFLPLREVTVNRANTHLN